MISSSWVHFNLFGLDQVKPPLLSSTWSNTNISTARSCPTNSEPLYGVYHTDIAAKSVHNIRARAIRSYGYSGRTSSRGYGVYHGVSHGVYYADVVTIHVRHISAGAIRGYGDSNRISPHGDRSDHHGCAGVYHRKIVTKRVRNIRAGTIRGYFYGL